MYTAVQKIETPAILLNYFNNKYRLISIIFGHRIYQACPISGVTTAPADPATQMPRDSLGPFCQLPKITLTMRPRMIMIIFMYDATNVFSR